MTDPIASPVFKDGLRITRADPVARPVAGLAGFAHRFATVVGIRMHYVDNGCVDNGCVDNGRVDNESVDSGSVDNVSADSGNAANGNIAGSIIGGEANDTALTGGISGETAPAGGEMLPGDERPVVVLLAGFPESWFAWRKVMPLLAPAYRVIAPDLPGQGDSDRPQGGYDTESLANAVHGLLSQLGIRRYFLAAHDIGAWVAFPYAALYGDEVRRLALLDAGIPGITMPDALPTAPDRAWRTWHFAFHAIADLPEVLIAGREREYLDWFLRRKTANPQAFTDTDIDEYLRTFKQDGGLRAGLAYYREAAVSAAQNRRLGGGGRLMMPVLALSADQGSITDMAAPLRAFADYVEGVMVPNCGHFLPEEQPAAVARELAGFFDAG